MHCLDCPINLDCLPGPPVRLFVFAVCQGQRNPLTAEMSSEICAKTSVAIIMPIIISVYFAKSNECLPFDIKYDTIALIGGGK